MLKKTDPSVIQEYFEDSSGLRGGHASEVALPENAQETAEYLKACSSRKTGVTISGGGTGVTGGRIPFGGTVLSTEKQNAILGIENGMIRVQGGVRVAEIHKAAEAASLIYPPDATEQNAFIGGNIATNAAGARSFKYGSTRKYVDRIKVALTNGEILELSRKGPVAKEAYIPKYQMPNCKNAAGYFSCPGMDLIDLFIGSEGTLGVVLEADLRLLKKQGFIFGCFAFFKLEDNALKFVAELKTKAKAGMDILAIEYFDKFSLKLLSPKYPNIPKDAGGMVFFEQEVSPAIENTYLEPWVALLDKYGLSDRDAWLADTPQKLQELLDFRHSLPELVNETVKRHGIPKIGTDMSVPAGAFNEMLAYYREHLEKLELDHLFFGHIGEDHLHVNVLPKNELEREKTKALYMKFVQIAVELGGTVSAEHGIGKLKHDFLKVMYGQKGIDEMVRVKKELDPACILGLGNIFPKELLVNV